MLMALKYYYLQCVDARMKSTGEWWCSVTDCECWQWVWSSDDSWTASTVDKRSPLCSPSAWHEWCNHDLIPNFSIWNVPSILLNWNCIKSIALREKSVEEMAHLIRLPLIPGTRNAIVFLVWEEFFLVFFYIASIDARHEIIKTFGSNFNRRNAVTETFKTENLIGKKKGVFFINSRYRTKLWCRVPCNCALSASAQRIDFSKMHFGWQHRIIGEFCFCGYDQFKVSYLKTK